MITSDWYSTTIDSISGYWSRIINFLPDIIGAIIIITVGIIIAKVLKWAVVTIIDALKIQQFFNQIHFTDIMKKAGIVFKADTTCGEFIKWLTIIIFLIPATKIIHLDAISTNLENLLRFIPNVAISVAIILIGTLFANFIGQIVKASSVSIGVNSSHALGALARYIIYIFIAFAAFFQLNVPIYLINVMFTGLITALAISTGLAFGLGGQNSAADLLKKIREDFRK